MIASEYGLDRDDVIRLARTNDDTPDAERVDAVRSVLDELIGAS